MQAIASNRLMLRKLLVITVVMFGFAFALVPFYKKICEVTGVNDIKTEMLGKNTQIDSTRWITVEFLANLNEQLPWKFTPLQTSVKIRPGELTQVEYEVTNTTGHEIVGQAIPSYGPALAGQFFKKIQCFCFSQQTLRPYERRRMPVIFVLDTNIPTDVNTITLSYTFFELKSPAKRSG